jgi:hypothetical protein
MIAQRKSRLCILCLASILIVSVTPATAGDSRDTWVHQGASTKDRIALQADGDAVMLNIHHVTGIGDAMLHLPTCGRSGRMIVRLHDFPALESFGARVADTSLECEQNRPEGVPAGIVCRVAGQEIDAVRREPDYFEVTLPPTLLESGGPVEIHWIDQWR